MWIGMDIPSTNDSRRWTPMSQLSGALRISALWTTTVLTCGNCSRMRAARSLAFCSFIRRLASYRLQISPILPMLDQARFDGPRAVLVLRHAFRGHLARVIAGVERGRPYAQVYLVSVFSGKHCLAKLALFHV